MKNIFDMLYERKGKYELEEKDWKLFIEDHKKNILEKSKIIVINYDDQNRYIYRLSEYLEYKNLDRSLTWIVLLLNQMKGEQDFHDRNKLIVPDINHLNSLYNQYQILKKKYKNIKKND